MRLTAILFAVIITSVCCQQEKQAEDYTGYYDTQFAVALLNRQAQWKDTIASISLKLPSSLDSFYRWCKSSDSSCERLQYRFANKNYAQFQESGFYYTARPDSVYQLTFFHDPVVKGDPNKVLSAVKASDSAHLASYLEHHATLCDDNKILRKEYSKINGRSFILIAFTSPCSMLTDKPTVFAGAITALDKVYLFALAESSASDSSGFVDMAFKTFRSLSIKDGRK